MHTRKPTHSMINRPIHRYQFDEKPRRLHRWSLFIATLGIALLVLGYFRIEQHDNQVRQASEVHAEQLAKVIATTPLKIDVTSMANQINQIINSHPEAKIGVAITDIKTDDVYIYGNTQPFLAASTAKLLTASLFLHEVESGQHSLGETVAGASAQDQLRQLIVNSDNDAWADFNDLLAHGSLTTWAKTNGLSSYDVNTNSLSAADMATLITKLYQGKLLGSSNTQLLLSYMQNASRTDLIKAYVPPTTTVYHKAGWLDDTLNDAAIIDDGNRPYALVIYTSTNGTAYDTTSENDIFQTITAATVSTFTKPIGS